MKSRIMSCASLMTLLCGLGFAVGQGTSTDKDKKALQGKWETTAGPKVVLDFVGDKLVSMDGDSGKELGSATFTVDSARTPRNIDVKVTSGEDKGKTFLGIYELNENELKLRISEPDSKRPTDFDPKNNPEQTLVTLTRIKAK